MSVLPFNVNLLIEERVGYFAATTIPFSITVYGDCISEVVARARDAVDLLLFSERGA